MMRVYGPGNKPVGQMGPKKPLQAGQKQPATSWRCNCCEYCTIGSPHIEFDKHGYCHNVFKLETVGDCYAAVAGLPDKDHAMAFCKFVRDRVKAMKNTTLKLDVVLGPDTSELERAWRGTKPLPANWRHHEYSWPDGKHLFTQPNPSISNEKIRGMMAHCYTMQQTMQLRSCSLVAKNAGHD
eukprot:scaffold26555_cov137-Cylindrotheca_fusiformis.AAC.2